MWNEQFRLKSVPVLHSVHCTVKSVNLFVPKDFTFQQAPSSVVAREG